MTALEAAASAPEPAPIVPPWAGGAARTRDRITLAFSSAALLLLWLLAHPYAGIIHDARLYVGRALADLDPQGLGHDLLFGHDGQSGFTLYRPLIRAGVITIGAGPAALSATLVNLCLWFAAAAALLSRFQRGRLLALALAATAVLDPTYGGFDVFRYGEAFASPRPLAEAAVMIGLALFAMGRTGWAILPIVIAATLHPVMALPGVLIAFLVHAQRRPLLWVLPVLGGLAALGAAALHLPLADRLLAVTDPAWNTVLEARTPYLFSSWWRPGDWGRVIVQFAVALFACAGLRGAHRSLLSAIVCAAAIGLAATAVFCDGLHDVLGLQLQPWRALWPLAVAANAAAPLVGLTLWNRGERGRAAMALLLLAWLVCQYDWGGLAAALACIGSAVAVLRMRRDPTRPITRGLLCIAAIVAVLEAGGAAWAAYAVLALGGAPGSSLSLLSLWRSGALTAAALGLGAGLLWVFRDRPFDRRTAAAVFVAVAVPTALLWDDRTAPERRIENGRPDPSLNAALGPGKGAILWVSGDAQPWLLARRANWATSIQGASIVFSRDLAMTWEDRMRRLIALGFATEADRAPFTPAKHFARGHAFEAVQTICAWSDRPDAVLIAGRRPIPTSVQWKPTPPEVRLMNRGTTFFWRSVQEYTVVRCADFAASPTSFRAGPRG